MNKTIIVACLCFVTIVFGAYNLGRVQATDKIENSVFNSVYVPPTTTPTNTPLPSPTATTPPNPDQVWENEKKLNSKVYKDFKLGKTGEDYYECELIRVGEYFAISTQISRTLTNFTSVLQKNQYLCVDVTLVNLMSCDYENLKKNYKLFDSYGYTYNPIDNIKGRGNVEGVIKSYGAFRRGEIVFEVPADQKQFKFIFNPDRGEEAGIIFDLNTNNLVPSN